MSNPFGGYWTKLKLEVLEEYLHHYVKVLQGKGFALWYIDAFAGSGSYQPAGSQEPLKGSAQIALDTDGFSHYLFIERSRARCTALKELLAGYPHRNTTVLHGDANEHLRKAFRTLSRRKRVALFLDPFGMQVEWDTLQMIADSGVADVWYLAPLSAAVRQMANLECNICAKKRAALTRLFGTTDWEDMYSLPPTLDMFNPTPSRQRTADVEQISRFLTARLKTLFPGVVGPAHLKMGSRAGPKGGPMIFALYFLVSNPCPRAKGLASRISQGILDRLRREGDID